MYICIPNLGALSSVGSEHLVYTQGVRGSNPLAPTEQKNRCISQRFFYVIKASFFHHFDQIRSYLVIPNQSNRLYQNYQVSYNKSISEN